MKIFITGATGFIGEHLLNKLINQGNTIHAIFRNESKIKHLQHPNIKWFKGDITNYNSIENAMQGCQQVYHIAAMAIAWEPNKGDFYHYNVEGTNNVLNAAKVCGVTKVVVTSTAGVYGPSFTGQVNETIVSQLPHFTGYEASKAESENKIRKRVAQGENIVIVNPTRVFGPGPLNQSNSVTRMIKLYTQGKWRFMLGNGKSIGNYTYVNDVVTGHILAMQHGIAGQSYILGGHNISYNTFFEILSEVVNNKRFMLHIPLKLILVIAHIFIILNKVFRITPPFTPAHIHKFNYNWVVSSNKAQTMLNYNITPIKQAFTETLNAI